MPFNIKVVVVSNTPKALDPDVTVVVGLPSANPWSLPFAHKPIFSENRDKYDLFIYSEDDMEVTHRNINAFIEISPHLAEDEIAGYLRYELDDLGNRTFPEIHGVFHWKPESVRKRGTFRVAEFSNEHAAFYILTRAQLKKCISSGGFLREPYEARYDMLCTAATDPYTSCGFRKVVCISDPDAFLIHHRPNRYAGQLGVSQDSFDAQIRVLEKIGAGERPAISLGVAESKLKNLRWSKGFYEEPCNRLLELIPPKASTILSIGCGSGEIEGVLSSRGFAVTVVPLDSVIGGVAAQRGVTVIDDTLPNLISLQGQRFDVVIATNLLHLCSTPQAFLRVCVEHLNPRGTLLLSGPNFQKLPILLKRAFAIGDFAKLRDYRAGSISVCTSFHLNAWLKQAGLNRTSLTWIEPTRIGVISGAHNHREVMQRRLVRILLAIVPKRLSAESWLLKGSSF